MPKINQTTLKSLPIPIPPLNEQGRIVVKVHQLMAMVDELEDQLAASRVTATDLLSALVTKVADTPTERKVSAQPDSVTGRSGSPCKSR